MRTETLAIVFTDIKGYTAATSSQTHQQNALMLKRIERLIEPVVRAYSGRVIKSIGDAYMIVFRSPTEAVRCATAVQDRLHQHNTSAAADQAIHIRIAMNIGEVRLHRGDVFGEPVNIAARIEAVTPADDIYLSEAVFLTMNKTDLPCERVGEFELKGIPQPVAVYRMKKFVHADKEGDPSVKAAGLPFGGTQLGHWKRMRWVRRAYISMWALAVAGLLGAAYMRYRPRADYTEMLSAMKTAIESQKATEALGLAGQIPSDAVQERTLARRFRRQAVGLLLQTGDLDTALTELGHLVNEDGRDAEALLLRGLAVARRGGDWKGAMTDIQSALKLNPSLGTRSEVAAVVIQAYKDPLARRTADAIVDTYIKQNAIPPLTHALNDAAYDRNARIAIGLRLEKLGASEDVDWVALALEDLKSTSCKTRKSAIARLVSEGDERAVGPLMKLAETKGCAAAQAEKAVEVILGK